jgi:hypothetical protein
MLLCAKLLYEEYRQVPVDFFFKFHLVLGGSRRFKDLTWWRPGLKKFGLGLCCVGPKNHSNLVDSASSHTLVSKIKPCTSKYKYFTVKLRMAHYISYSLFDSPLLLG